MTEEKRKEAREGIARMREAAREVSRLNDRIYDRPPGVSAATLEPAIRAGAERIGDLLQQLGIDPDHQGAPEVPDRRTVAEVIAGAAIRGALASGELVPGREPECAAP